MGNALSSGSACPMEEDILRFIESDSFKVLIAEEAADEMEELDMRKKRKRNVIQRCTNLWQDAPKSCHGRYRNLGGQEVSTPIPDGLSDVQGSFSAHVQRN